MEQLLPSKARLENCQDNSVASQTSSSGNNTHFYRDDLSVPADTTSLLDAISGKVMALDGLVGFIMCFLHLSMLKKHPFFIEMPWHFGWICTEVPGCKQGKGYIKGFCFLVFLLLKCVLASQLLEGKQYHSEWKEHWSLYLKYFLLHLLRNTFK